MPLPMVHLAVAVECCRSGGALPSPAFLLGSLAPDAIHMRPGAGREEKRLTHVVPGAADWDDFAAMRAFIASFPTPGRREFAEGYVSHVLTDRLWLNAFYLPFAENVPAALSTQDRRALYYRETDQIDFELYHRQEWRAEVWERLRAAAVEDFAAMLSAEEIERWRERVLHWFDGLKQEPGIQPAYFAYPQVEAFIVQASTTLSGQLRG